MRLAVSSGWAASLLLAVAVLLLAQAPMPVQANSECVACTLVVAIVEQLVVVDNSTVDEEVSKLCSRFPSSLRKACDTFINIYGPAIINLLEEKNTPDVVCQSIKLCTNPQCNLFPAPKGGQAAASARARYLLRSKRLDKPLKDLPAICKLPGIKEICDLINNWGNNHFPIDDVDKDDFSPAFTLRGGHWRGRDCDDYDAEVRPGRQPVDNDRDRDSNCNGIYGVDPTTGKTYEELLCGGADNRGVIVLGDSASAHFHIPEQYMEAEYIGTHSATYQNLMLALENEFDWPMLSATTAFMNDTEWRPDVVGPVNSTYMLINQRNLCNHRDYQNIAVNGARSGAMNSTIQNSMARNQKTDKPAIVVYALIGNDVCNGHVDTLSDMTTPEEMYANAMGTMHFLNGRLPAGSSVLFTGLADGRILYQALHDRIHPLGQLRNDVTYAQLYDYLNCLNISPCRGWMNSNSTLRDLTTERAQNLSMVLKGIAENESFDNFKMYYMDNPLKAAIASWEAAGGQAWQLIEPIDGFHPNQIAQPLIVDTVWQVMAQQFPELIPAINPNNDLIRELFGDQGGY